MRLLMVIGLALLANAALAATFKEPYALVESGEASETRKEGRVVVSKVDGKSVRSTRHADPIAPGSHHVTLRFTSARGQFRPEYQDVALNLDACTRYRIVAAYESRLGGDWTPRVYAEPIGECRKKFAMP